jgi:hypothetical protein
MSKLADALAVFGMLALLDSDRKITTGFHLPEIAEEDRIRVNTPKIRKHATKRRINKLHEKSKKQNPIKTEAF